jgi:hypothetical protein
MRRTSEGPGVAAEDRASLVFVDRGTVGSLRDLHVGEGDVEIRPVDGVAAAPEIEDAVPSGPFILAEDASATAALQRVPGPPAVADVVSAATRRRVGATATVEPMTPAADVSSAGAIGFRRKPRSRADAKTRGSPFRHRVRA